MAPLAFQAVRRNDSLVLSQRDVEAIERIISWDGVQPRFSKPGRTAWYVLQDPVQSSNGGPLLRAAKLKGVGAWNPADPSIRSGVKGDHPVGMHRPSVTEYKETARTVHFGIGAEGEFKGVHSESAPFGAILLRRASQEYDNAEVLSCAGVSSIVPFMLARYGGLFKAEPIGAVVSLAPDDSPHGLDFLYQREPEATDERRAHCLAVLTALGEAGGLDEHTLCSAQSKVSALVGRSLRRFAQAGLYRYSSAWDNFFFNKRDADVYLTDLDSSRPLSELPPDIGGMQVLRDLAGALWRLPKQFCERATVGDFHLQPLLKLDALAAMVAAYFKIDAAASQRLVDPLWAYFIPHWFLLKRHGAQVAGWTKDQSKGYRIEKSEFHCLAILVLAEVYRERREALGLPPLPATTELHRRMRSLLGEQMDQVAWLAQRSPSSTADFAR